ncbi:MAG: hypothetical protein IJ475_03335 [Bacilli bacterium]|nr:hypothetical protein [Bacilli bacterium]
MKKKTFMLENDIGIEIKYTVLGITSTDDKYVVYTNYLPSDNEFGIRLFASKLISEEPFKVEKLSKVKEKEVIEAFKVELIHLASKEIKK